MWFLNQRTANLLLQKNQNFFYKDAARCQISLNYDLSGLQQKAHQVAWHDCHPSVIEWLKIKFCVIFSLRKPNSEFILTELACGLGDSHYPYKSVGNKPNDRGCYMWRIRYQSFGEILSRKGTLTFLIG